MFPVELAFRVAGLVYDEAGGDPHEASQGIHLREIPM